MILIKKDAEWPLVREQDPHTLLWRPTEATLACVVANGVLDWMQKAGEQPTDVIFGRKACLKFREECAQHHMVNVRLAMPEDPFENTYHGLTFHRDREAEGVILLIRGPARKMT